jgi:integrase/recombinase XerD
MVLPLWVEFFDDLKNVRGRSRNTVMAYRRDLELFEEFVRSHSDISRIYEFMKTRQLSQRSQARVISSLRTYFHFCERKNPDVQLGMGTATFKAADMLRELRPPRVKHKLPRPLTPAEFEALYRACEVENTYKTTRNQITLLLLYGLGCRVSELIGLNLHDFNATGSWLAIEGKAGKQRLVPLTDRLREDLTLYLRETRPHLVQESLPAILVNDRGHRPSRVDIWRWLAAWSVAAGFDHTVHPHQFRHGCATTLLENGADLRSIQMLLGHTSLQTTQIYTTVTRHKMRAEIEAHHPLSQSMDKDSEADGTP